MGINKCKSKRFRARLLFKNLPFENTVNTLPLETIDYLLKSDLNLSSESELSKSFNNLYKESKDHFDFQSITESLLINGINLFKIHINLF